MYQRTGIPLAGVLAPYQGQISGTVPATSRGQALTIVARVRKQYQICLAAYAAQAKYTADKNAYESAKSAYQKKWHDLKPHRLKDGKLVKPPSFTETQPTIPADCPGPRPRAAPGPGDLLERDQRGTGPAPLGGDACAGPGRGRCRCRAGGAGPSCSCWSSWWAWSCSPTRTSGSA